MLFSASKNIKTIIYFEYRENQRAKVHVYARKSLRVDRRHLSHASNFSINCGSVFCDFSKSGFLSVIFDAEKSIELPLMYQINLRTIFKVRATSKGLKTPIFPPSKNFVRVPRQVLWDASLPPGAMLLRRPELRHLGQKLDLEDKSVSAAGGRLVHTL